MPSRVRKRKERYMRWVHACVEYLKETGEKRSANWLFENIDCCNQREGLYKKNVAEGKIRENTQYRPPNVNSASNKLRASGLLKRAYLGDVATNSAGSKYKVMSWWYE